VHITGVRRKPGSLVPSETAICVAAARLRKDGVRRFHGYLLAKEMKDDGARVPAFGTLYRALGRLEKMEMLTSAWEDPHAAAKENRPRRRLYTITAAGLKVAAEANASRTEPARSRKLVPA